MQSNSSSWCICHHLRTVSQILRGCSYATKSGGIQTETSTSIHRNVGFVPPHRDTAMGDVTKLQQFVTDAQRVLILTGAGLSTESGIPDYRSEDVGLYARTTRRPMQYQEFIKSASARQRYWARNFVGWPQFSSFHPNASHHALFEWQQKGKVLGLVTQNVDALHSKAGSDDVIELHGCSHRVRCLSCLRVSKRSDLQIRFEEANPTWSTVDVPIAPDGDVLLEDDQVRGFQVPSCVLCGGVLMPNVTFFGDSVPRPLVDSVYSMVDLADALLVCGSSLHVWSGYRFVTRASERKIPIAIVNVGTTRADALAMLKIEVLCGSLLPQIVVPLTENS